MDRWKLSTLSFLIAVVFLLGAVPVAAQEEASSDMDSSSTMMEAEDMEPSEAFRLKVGEVKSLSIGVNRISVTNPTVISAQVRDDRRGISVVAIGTGQSDLLINAVEGPDVLYRFYVSGRDLDEDLQELKALLADSGLIGLIASRTANNLVVRGRILKNEELAKFNQIKDRFDLIDLVEKKISTTEYEARLATFKDKLGSMTPGERLRVEVINLETEEPTLWLKGVLFTDQAANEIETLASEFFPRVLNQISLEKPMIEIDVIFATVDLTKGRDRGNNTLWNDLVNGSLSGGFTGAFGEDLPNTSDYLYNYSFLSGETTQQLRLQQRDSMVVGFFEQAQSVESGESASFRDGGVIYVPLITDDTQTVEAIETGVNVTVEPEIRDNGTVRTRIDIRNISPKAPVYGGQVETDEVGTQTTLTVEPERTIVISAFDSDSFQTSDDSTPLLEKIPIVNMFFKAKSQSNQNRRSYIFLTPTFATVEDGPGGPFSASAPQYREYLRDQSKFRETGLGFWLGWEDDFPPPSESDPNNPIPDYDSN